MDYHEIVKKLVGGITPIGVSEHDDLSNDNLKKMIHLTEMLMMDIQDVMFKTKDRHEGSIKRAYDHAAKFCDQLKSND